MKNIEIILITLIIDLTKCNPKPENTNRKPLHNIRMQMEEITDEQLFAKSPKHQSSDNLVSFLVENVRELFNNTDNSSIKVKSAVESNHFRGLLDTFKTTTASLSLNQSSSAEMEQFKSHNVALTFLFNPRNDIVPILSDTYSLEKMLLSSLINIEAKTERNRVNKGPHCLRSSVTNGSIITNDTDAFRKSCIACDNVMIGECNDPKYKLVPSIICERTDDLCYSQHTPFGLIDRGCFNVNHNLTLFVCACNLCNYISISEMPYIFSNKRDWIENVIELSHAKHFRDSNLKDMSCLKCEVNATSKRGDRIADVHCWEGHIAMLPTQACAPDEICVTKAIRSEGYIWRGCTDKHFYNYWFTLCDTDLCNYDSIASIYDTD